MNFIEYNKNYRPKLNQAVIFVGGKGLRLGNLTKKTPKPLLKIKKKIFLDILIQNLSRFGIKKILLLCNFKSTRFFKRYHRKNFFGINIKCALDNKKLSGKLMAIKSNIKKVDKNFILMNGDTFVDLNFKQYQYFFERNSLKCLSFFLEKKLSKEDKKRYYFKSFNKKNSVNSGIFFINKDLLKLIPVSNKNFDEEIIKLIKKRNDTCKILNLSNIKFIDIGIKKDFSFFKKNLDYFLKKKALFLDRDGVINQDLKYVHKTKDFFWRKDIFSFLKKVISKNYYIFVITNQSGIGRSYYSEKDFFKLNKWILNMLSSKGLHIDDIAWSPYYKFSKKYNSSKFYKLRKPNSGMIDYLKKKWMIDMKNSVFLGDSKVDEMLAKKTDLRFVKVNNNTKLKNITI